MMSMWDLPLRTVSNRARDLLAISNIRQPPRITEAQASSQLHLPEVLLSAQYLIDMGFTPPIAQRLYTVSMAFVKLYGQGFESHFDRIICGGCRLHPDYYRNVFTVRYERTIQAWTSQFFSTVWVRLHQGGLHPATLQAGRVDIRVDDATKVEILTQLGFKSPSLAADRTDPRCGEDLLPPPEKDKGGITSTNKLAITCPLMAVSLISSTWKSTSSHRDPFDQAPPSTCFPARYPPPPGEPFSSSQRPLVATFTRTASVRSERPLVNHTTSVSSLLFPFGDLTVTTAKVGPKTQRKCEGVWASSPMKTETVSSPPSLIVGGLSEFSDECRSARMPSTSSTEPTAVFRRRKIAILPKRHRETPARPTHSPLTPDPTVIPCPYNAVPHTPSMPTTPLTIAKKAYPDHGSGAPEASLVVPPARSSEEKSIRPVSKLTVTERKKTVPLPCRLPSRLRVTPPIQESTGPRLSDRKESPSTLSRTPSLVSDTSCGDSPSESSDELDTPPSTPAFSSTALPTSPGAGSTVVPINPTRTSPQTRSLALRDAKLPKPRGLGIHIDLTKGSDGGERPFTFIFHAERFS